MLALFLFFPAEIPPPAPLQTQDGSAVAKNGQQLFFFNNFLGPVAADCAETFYLCKDDPTTPSKHPTVKVNTSQQHWDLKGRGQCSKKQTTLQHRYGITGVFLGTQTIFVCYILDMWTKKKKKGEKAYIYTFVQKRHMEPRHYWCSVYTQTRCRRSHLSASCRFHSTHTDRKRIF